MRFASPPKVTTTAKLETAPAVGGSNSTTRTLKRLDGRTKTRLCRPRWRVSLARSLDFFYGSNPNTPTPFVVPT